MRKISRRDGKKTFVSFQESPEQIIRIETIASMQGITRSEYLRRTVAEAVDALLNRRKNSAQENIHVDKRACRR